MQAQESQTLWDALNLTYSLSTAVPNVVGRTTAPVPIYSCLNMAWSSTNVSGLELLTNKIRTNTRIHKRLSSRITQVVLSSLSDKTSGSLMCRLQSVVNKYWNLKDVKNLWQSVLILYSLQITDPQTNTHTHTQNNNDGGRGLLKTRMWDQSCVVRHRKWNQMLNVETIPSRRLEFQVLGLTFLHGRQSGHWRQNKNRNDNNHSGEDIQRLGVQSHLTQS